MKKIEFKTGKGEFVLVDGYDVINGGVKISEINEQQASEVVDLFTEYSKMYQDYERPPCGYDNAIDSLHSLIKSKGIYLYENPYKDYLNTDDYDLAEQKTFYNPYIFKKI